MNLSKLIGRAAAWTAFYLAGWAIPTAWAQSASLTANANTYAAAGGTVTFTASVNYTGVTPSPTSYTLQVNLPTGWTFASQSLGGLTALASPSAGDNTLEWLFSPLPQNSAAFSFTVNYPVSLSGNQIVTIPTAQLRSPVTPLTIPSITFTPAPTAVAITTQPTAQTVTAGGSATFTVAATGNPAPTYQWRKNASPINGATAASYTIATVAAGDAGNYDVIVSNTFPSSATSNAATLTVNFGPSITTQPAPLTVNQGQPATFSVVATGNPAPTYQWRKNTATITGATNASLTIPSAQSGDAASYDVVVTNNVASATSNAAALTVVVPPAITTQPSSATVNAGQGASFTVAASGTTPLTYVWKKGTTQLSDGGNVSGSSTATLSLSTTSSADNSAS